ncbi:9661_t:CDS:1, partial [Cetraspora pellucida]
MVLSINLSHKLNMSENVLLFDITLTEDKTTLTEKNTIEILK